MMQGKLVVVVGAGRSGLSAVALLLNKGAKVRLLDSNPQALTPEQKSNLHAQGVDIRLGAHQSKDFNDTDLIVHSPGIPRKMILQQLETESTNFTQQPEILAEMELSWRYLQGEPILAITGTSGKTTTASLAAAMLQAQGYNVFLGGNIGTPLAEYILDGRRADVLVLEISSFQLQSCFTFHPRVAVLLNISPNHLDYHKDMQEYTDAKFRLFRCQDAKDLAILGESLKTVAKQYPLKAQTLWLEQTNRFPGSHLLGQHNQFNMEAAWQACRFLGVTEENATSAVAGFAPLPNRLEKVRELRDVLYVNDSKSTTVSALKVALLAFERPILLLCGGKFKGGNLEELAPLVRQKVRAVYLFGASREYFENAWRDLLPISWYPTLEPAILAASKQAVAGDVVLMSPATASFDLYKNYIERGNAFKNIVKALA